MAALAAAGHRALGSMGRIPTKRFAASRSASLRFDGLYIDPSRSNARTLSAPLWRIGRLRDFRAESVSQSIATSHGSEDERFDGTESPARFPHLRYAFFSTASRTQRDILPGTARLHRSEHRRLREPFSPIRTKRGTESPAPPPIPPGSLYSGKPPCSIPEPPPFLEHEKREIVQMEQGGGFNMTSF